jgi:hypothetical protein
MMWRRSWRSFGAGAWVFPCDPALPAGQALVVWNVAIQPTAVVLGTAPFPSDSNIEFADCPAAILTQSAPEGRHEIWPADDRQQQVFIVGKPDGGTATAAIVQFDAHTEIRLDAVRRLWRRLTGRSTTALSLPITTQQRRRLVLMLRALDGWGERATYRELAANLLNADVRRQGRHDWLTSTTRAQIIRMVRDAVQRMEGGYRELLIGR